MKLPNIGKLDKKVFDEVILPKLGRRDKNVLISPMHGVDAAIRISRDAVMVVAEDPTFGMPVLMPFFGWAIVHICAGDVAYSELSRDICIYLFSYHRILGQKHSR